MKTPVRYILLLIAVTVALEGCTKSKPTFGIYLVQGEKRDLTDELRGPDVQHAMLTQLLTDHDIEAYDWPTHRITLTRSGEELLFGWHGKSGPLDLRGKEFIVVAEGQRCYGGAFWLSIWSQTYAHPVINVQTRNRTIWILRDFGDAADSDPRSDPRIKRALQQAGKIRNADHDSVDATSVATVDSP